MRRIMLGLISAIVLASPSLAADPPKLTVDMTARVMDFDNKPIKDFAEATIEDRNCAKCRDMTLGDVIWFAVNQVLVEGGRPEEIPPATRQAWVYIVAKVKSEPAAVLTPKERDAFIDRVSKVYTRIAPVIAVRAPMMIDPNWSVPELK